MLQRFVHVPAKNMRCCVLVLVGCCFCYFFLVCTLPCSIEHRDVKEGQVLCCVFCWSNSKRENVQREEKESGLSSHVGRDINLLGELGDLNLEAGLDALQDLGVSLVSDKGDGKTLGTETTGTTDTMEVGVGDIRDVVVDDDVDTGDIETTGKDVGGDEDTLVELLEGLVFGNTIRLLHRSVNGDTGEVALNQELVELLSTGNRLDKDADLVELKGIQEVVELAVLLGLGDSDVVLLETVEGELGLVIDVNLEGVLHELLASNAGVLAQSSGEHHDLLVVRGGPENLLNIAAHICSQIGGKFDTVRVMCWGIGRLGLIRSRGGSKHGIRFNVIS